jgi:hypothetical protein
MRTGTVKTFNSERGFGFITRDTGGTDIFFTLIKSTKASKSYLEDKEFPSRRCLAQEADVRKLVMSGLCNG